jgi:hypothetical protein
VLAHGPSQPPSLPKLVFAQHRKDEPRWMTTGFSLTYINKAIGKVPAVMQRQNLLSTSR